MLKTVQVFTVEEAEKIIAESDTVPGGHGSLLNGKIGVCTPNQWVVDRLTAVLDHKLPTIENCVGEMTSPPRVTKYSPGSEVAWHLDENYTHYYLKALLVLLSDAFDGGKFTYRDENREETVVPLKVGEGVLFNGTTYHSVTKVTSGVRWTVGAWVDIGRG